MTATNPPEKTLTKNPLGPTGEAVAANVERLRTGQNLTFAALAQRLDDIGRPIPTLGLRKIVAQTRRVDSDDLVALAQALGVSPITLLMPSVETGDDQVDVTGVTNSVAAMTLWRWLLAELPMPGDKRIPIAFQIDARPAWWWHREAEKEEQDHVERRTADRNLAEAGWLDDDSDSR